MASVSVCVRGCLESRASGKGREDGFDVLCSPREERERWAVSPGDMDPVTACSQTALMASSGQSEPIQQESLSVPVAV